MTRAALRGTITANASMIAGLWRGASRRYPSPPPQPPPPPLSHDPPPSKPDEPWELNAPLWAPAPVYGQEPKAEGIICAAVAPLVSCGCRRPRDRVDLRCPEQPAPQTHFGLARSNEVVTPRRPDAPHATKRRHGSGKPGRAMCSRSQAGQRARAQRTQDFGSRPPAREQDHCQFVPLQGRNI